MKKEDFENDDWFIVKYQQETVHLIGVMISLSQEMN